MLPVSLWPKEEGKGPTYRKFMGFYMDQSTAALGLLTALVHNDIEEAMNQRFSKYVKENLQYWHQDFDHKAQRLERVQGQEEKGWYRLFALASWSLCPGLGSQHTKMSSFLIYSEITFNWRPNFGPWGDDPEEKISSGMLSGWMLKSPTDAAALSLIYLLVVLVLLISPTLGDMGIYMTDFYR
ncbi:hypothetical protein DUI87_00573 [Hirundo rustica rustica]|uniref:Uncharacterized protein n=1 Tax=Hirundo rustica rustica TaxID=333673 RepID=A0A3M0L9I5_HIRRU|nr:hypothetical protein DUI87_00573 [Hirundo rustica rustica]